MSPIHHISFLATTCSCYLAQQQTKGLISWESLIGISIVSLRFYHLQFLIKDAWNLYSSQCMVKTPCQSLSFKTPQLRPESQIWPTLDAVQAFLHIRETTGTYHRLMHLSWLSHLGHWDDLVACPLYSQAATRLLRRIRRHFLPCREAGLL